MTIDLVENLTAEGFTELPVVKLEREGDSWQEHQPDRIAAYQPKLSECDLRFNAGRGPKLGVWRR
jgi:hypothetical protein